MLGRTDLHSSRSRCAPATSPSTARAIARAGWATTGVNAWSHRRWRASARPARSTASANRPAATAMAARQAATSDSSAQSDRCEAAASASSAAASARARSPRSQRADGSRARAHAVDIAFARSRHGRCFPQGNGRTHPTRSDLDAGALRQTAPQIAPGHPQRSPPTPARCMPVPARSRSRTPRSVPRRASPSPEGEGGGHRRPHARRTPPLRPPQRSRARTTRTRACARSTTVSHQRSRSPNVRASTRAGRANRSQLARSWSAALAATAPT